MAKGTKAKTIKIEIPLTGDPPTGYVSRHVDVRLDPDQANSLRRILDGLAATGACLRNKRRIETIGDALRWLLEQVDQPAPA